MKRQGVCQKCGKETIVRDHHINGYLGENKDTVAPYCQSCDLKAHAKAKREGRCNLKPDVLYLLSIKSSNRRNKWDKRNRKTYTLSCKTLESDTVLFEHLHVYSTGKISINSYFIGNNGLQLKRICE